ncbi:MAG: hypothetical protein R3Y06_08055 [Faecalibacterium sp.]
MIDIVDTGQASLDAPLPQAAEKIKETQALPKEETPIAEKEESTQTAAAPQESAVALENENTTVVQEIAETEKTPEAKTATEAQETIDAQDSNSFIEAVVDTTATIIDTVADASTIIATNPEKVDEIVSDATEALATTAVIASGAPPAPHVGRLIGLLSNLLRNIFHLFRKGDDET